MPRCSAKPCRYTRWDPTLGVLVRAVFGYRAECACGYYGDVRRTITHARADAREHRDSHAAPAATA